jgi:hypothetical protein
VTSEPDGWIFIVNGEEDKGRISDLRSHLDTQRVLDSYRLGPKEFLYWPTNEPDREEA